MKTEKTDAAEELYKIIMGLPNKQKEVAVVAGLRTTHFMRPKAVAQRDLILMLSMATMVVDIAEKMSNTCLSNKQPILDKLINSMIAAYGIGQQRGKAKMAKKLKNKKEVEKHIIPITDEVLPYEGRFEEWNNEVRKKVMDQYADDTKMHSHTTASIRHASVRS